MFFCEAFQDFEKTGYRQDIPGNAMPPLSEWVTKAINEETPQEHLDRLGFDGYGLIVKVLRDIKTSWKLLLGEMEDFLEDFVSRLGLFRQTALTLHRRNLSTMQKC